MRLNEVEEGEYEYPHQVYEVPKQSYFFYHFVVATTFKYATNGHQENNQVYKHPLKNVEAVETSYEEEEVGILLLHCIFIFVEVCPEYQSI